MTATKTRAHEEAFRAGWNAWFANETEEVCTLRPMTVEWLAWIHGHGAAEKRAEAELGTWPSYRLPMEPLPILDELEEA